jgi:hypothetical protein
MLIVADCFPFRSHRSVLGLGLGRLVPKCQPYEDSLHATAAWLTPVRGFQFHRLLIEELHVILG